MTLEECDTLIESYIAQIAQCKHDQQQTLDKIFELPRLAYAIPQLKELCDVYADRAYLIDTLEMELETLEMECDE